MSKYNHNPQNCVTVNESATVEQATATGVDEFPLQQTGILRVPVILGTYDITSHLTAKIKFPHPVLEIKDVKKRVEIVQCRLMTDTATTVGGSISNDATFPLYIKGYVRKNIQYASPSYNASGECVSSDMRSFTTRIPFEVTALVTLEDTVILPVVNQRSEYDFAITKDLGPGHPEKDQFNSSDLSQFHQQSTHFYNALPYCEIVSHTINEWDEALDREALDPINDPTGEGHFRNILEKMMLTFTIRVLQVQSMEVDEG